MMVAKTSTFLTTLLVASLHNSGHAFAPAATSTRNGGAGGPLNASAEESAQAFSDYMAKSHVEKLRAVKDAEQKKNAEIEALKAEIEQLKSAPSPSPVVAQSSGGLFEQRNAKVAAAAAAGKSRWGSMEADRAAQQATSTSSGGDSSTAELEKKLESYQLFISEYIVNSQNQKLLAVKEAELKMEKKFQERLEQLFSSAGMALPPSSPGAITVPSQAAAVEPTLFDKRNARVIAAGEAGKSRWGSMEVDRAAGKAITAPAATEASGVSAETAEPTLYEKRNANVAAAAEKSRWGSMEVERAQNSGVVTVNVEEKPATQVSLKDRLNLGARLLGVPSETLESSLYEKRNARVIAAGEAGKSRWGSMEVERIKNSGVAGVNASVGTVEPTMYQQRNARVIAAGEAGKSRWGSMEVERIKNSGVAGVNASVGTAEPTMYQQRNARVIAAGDAGKSRWGSMEVERIKTIGVAVTNAPVGRVEPTMYQQRNAHVVAAASAGKSRWGSMEVERIKNR